VGSEMCIRDRLSSVVDMKVLFLTNGPIEHPPSRHRVYQYLDYLRACGIEPTVSPGLSRRQYAMLWGTHRRTPVRAVAINLVTAQRRLFDLLRLKDFDVVVIQRNILSTFVPLFEMLICGTHPAVVLDFDDLIFGSSFASIVRRNGRWWSDKLLRNRMDRVVAAANHIIVGSPYLVERTERINPAVTLIPTPIDLRRYTVRPPVASGSKLVIGWKGSPGTSRYLLALRPVFEELVRRYGRKIQVVAHGDEHFRPFGSYMEVHPFHLDTEIRELHQFDIGVMPLDSDELSLGKCAFKALEYMAAGVPSVSSRVGFIRDIVRDGENGMLAGPPTEWIEKLSLLIEHDTLRARLAQEGRRTVERDFSVDVTGPRLAGVLLSLIHI